jgi:hypothetical protein
MDLIRWPRDESYPVRWPGEMKGNYSFETGVRYLKAWLRARTTFLDATWQENEKEEDSDV